MRNFRKKIPKILGSKVVQNDENGLHLAKKIKKSFTLGHRAKSRQRDLVLFSRGERPKSAKKVKKKWNRANMVVVRLRYFAACGP